MSGWLASDRHAARAAATGPVGPPIEEMVFQAELDLEARS
jgi:hypothetical protein